MPERLRDAKGRFVSMSENGNAGNVSNSSETIDRLDFARRAGWQFDNKRDIYTVAGYKKEPHFEDYWSYWDRHPIAGRIVDLPAKTTWKDPPEIVEPEKEDGTEFTAAFEELADRLKLWSRFERVDRLSRIGQYAVLLIGATDGDLEMPLASVQGPDGIAFLSQYSQRDAEILTYVQDRGDARFGLPEFYGIDLARRNTRFQPGKQRVHWSRILHVAEDTLEDDIHGRPVLRRVLNTIFNDEKVDAASAEAFWQLADKILQMKIDPEARLSEEAEKKFGEAMEEIMHDLRRQIVTQGGEVGWIGGDTPDPSALSDVLATKLAVGGNPSIPKRILFGSERGELASSQDERTWFGAISERQEHHAEPNIVRALIDRFIEIKALPRPGADGYEVQWPNLFEPSEEELAERNRNTAETAAKLTAIGGDPYELIEVDDEGIVMLRPSEEVWDERDREPGEPIQPPMDMGPPEAQEEEEEEEEEMEPAA